VDEKAKLFGLSRGHSIGQKRGNKREKKRSQTITNSSHFVKRERKSEFYNTSTHTQACLSRGRRKKYFGEEISTVHVE